MAAGRNPRRKLHKRVTFKVTGVFRCRNCFEFQRIVEYKNNGEWEQTDQKTLVVEGQNGRETAKVVNDHNAPVDRYLRSEVLDLVFGKNKFDHPVLYDGYVKTYLMEREGPLSAQ